MKVNYTSVYNFQKKIKVKKPVKKAKIYVSAMGVYALYCNKIRVGKGILAPGWTSYDFHTQYQSYDITDMLKTENCIEIGVGSGWAAGCIGHLDNRHAFVKQSSVIAQLEITYLDKSSETVISDSTWSVYTSEVLSSEIYHGETIDKTAKIEYLGKAKKAEVKTKLIPQIGEWITEHEKLAPKNIIHTPAGETVIDFGQNMTGYVELRIKGNKGDRVVIHHAEVLDKEGNFYNDNYRSARNENIYVLSGEEDIFKPLYSFQGFRYIKLVEFPLEKVDPNMFRAIVVHSEIKRTGHFCCGNQKINQLYHNVIWGQKSNYLDIPTDCPQRDERLGWTGDAQVFCRTAAINFDVERFFEKWLSDVALEQTKEGAVYGIVPSPKPLTYSRISAAWGDVACIAPWEIYLAYGNKKALKKNFPMMKKWVEYIRRSGSEEYLWLTGVHFGDWLALDAGENSYIGATSNDLIASAFYAYSTQLVIKAGEVIGEDVTEYRELYKNIIKAFQSYFMENGLPKAELPLTELCNNTVNECVDTVRKGITQTALVLILHFNLCKEEDRKKLADMLSQLIISNKNRISTGFVGTPYILHALSENGYTDLAYTLLMQEKNPSWLYSVCHGATTMWEHWNGIKEDGSFWSSDMNSFNHYAYGAVYDWIFGVAIGIKPMEKAPAYKEFSLEPHPNKCLGFAKASFESRNGLINIHWYYKENTVYYEFEIPDGTTAHLRLPSGYTATLNGGTYHFAE